MIVISVRSFRSGYIGRAGVRGDLGVASQWSGSGIVIRDTHVCRAERGKL